MVQPDIILTPKHILFPVLPEGEKMNLILHLKNNSNEDFICEWLTPPNKLSGLIIMPKVFELESGKIITCIMEFQSKFRPYSAFSFEEIQKEIVENFQKNFFCCGGKRTYTLFFARGSQRTWKNV